MYTIPLWVDREVCIYGKEDGNAAEKNHLAHSHFFSVNQTHGTGVFVIPQDEFRPWKLAHEADALFTIYNKPLGVYVADCTPLVLVWKHAHAIVHVSWKTLRSWLVQSTLELFHRHNEVVVAVYLWPSIKHYEVGEEFEHFFPETFLHPHRDKYLFDLPWYVISILLARWISRDTIVVDEWCTRRDTEKFRGYRRGDKEARNFVGVRVVG